MTPETLNLILTVAVGPVLWLIVEQLKKRVAPDVSAKQTTGLVVLLAALITTALLKITGAPLDWNLIIMQGFAVAGSASLTNGGMKKDIPPVTP